MQTVTITPEMLRNAPDKPASKRGRQKGTSPVAIAFRGFYGNENENAIGFSLTNSEYAALRVAVNRENGTESSKVADYSDSLSALNLTEVFLGQTGEGTERVITIALTRPAEDEN